MMMMMVGVRDKDAPFKRKRGKQYMDGKRKIMIIMMVMVGVKEKDELSGTSWRKRMHNDDYKGIDLKDKETY